MVFITFKNKPKLYSLKARNPVKKILGKHLPRFILDDTKVCLEYIMCKNVGLDYSGPRRSPISDYRESDHYTTGSIKGTQPSVKRKFSKITFYPRSSSVSKLVTDLS